jgi:hypothetical protein
LAFHYPRTPVAVFVVMLLLVLQLWAAGAAATEIRAGKKPFLRRVFDFAMKFFFFGAVLNLADLLKFNGGVLNYLSPVSPGDVFLFCSRFLFAILIGLIVGEKLFRERGGPSGPHVPPVGKGPSAGPGPGGSALGSAAGREAVYRSGLGEEDSEIIPFEWQGSVNGLSPEGLRAAVRDPAVTDERTLGRALAVFFGGEKLSKDQAMDRLRLLLAGGVDTNTAAIVPLYPEDLESPERLEKIEDGALAYYPKGIPIRFLTRDGAAPAEFTARYAGRDEVRVEAAPDFFDEGKLKAVESHIPAGAVSVRVYESKDHPLDRRGVTDERLKREDSVVPLETLGQFMDRLERLAKIIEEQA